MTPIIFLDCDGVINCVGEMSEIDAFRLWAEGGGLVLQDRVNRLRELVEATDAQVVISSTWRLRFDRERMVKLLGDWLEPRLHERWATTDRFSRRGPQIAHWLYEADPEPPYLILDDEVSDHLAEQARFTVKTVSTLGLQPADVEKAKEILSRQVG